jgi:hypothetical protein
MKTETTIQILEDYNKWRRGDESIENPLPTEIGHAIDDAVRKLKAAEEYEYHITNITRELGKALAAYATEYETGKELRKRLEELTAE